MPLSWGGVLLLTVVESKPGGCVTQVLPKPLFVSHLLMAQWPGPVTWLSTDSQWEGAGKSEEAGRLRATCFSPDSGQR